MTEQEHRVAFNKTGCDRLLMMFLVLVQAFAFHAVSEANAQTRSSEQTIISSKHSGDSHFSLTRSSPDGWFEVRAQGILEFTDDDSDVKVLARNGYISISELAGGISRKLHVSPDPEDRLERRYLVRDRPHPFDQSARDLLSSALTEIVRHSGMAAASRTDRILKQRGMSGVLEEISLIRSDGAKRIYFTLLLETFKSDPDALREIIRHVGREIDSDGEKANLLIAHADLYLNEPGGASEFFDSIGAIHSDGQRGRLLLTILGRHNLRDSHFRNVLRVASAIGSDGEKANVLIKAIRIRPSDPEALSAIQDVARSIKSEGERRRVISVLSKAQSPRSGDR